MTDTIKRLRALHEAALVTGWRQGVGDKSDVVYAEDADIVACCDPRTAALIAAMGNALPALLDVAEEAAAALEARCEVGYQIRLDAALARLDGES